MHHGVLLCASAERTKFNDAFKNSLDLLIYLDFLTPVNLSTKLSLGNYKEYAPFSRLYLELLTMKKHADQNTFGHKKMPILKDMNY